MELRKNDFQWPESGGEAHCATAWCVALLSASEACLVSREKKTPATTLKSFKVLLLGTAGILVHIENEYISRKWMTRKLGQILFWCF